MEVSNSNDSGCSQPMPVPQKSVANVQLALVPDTGSSSSEIGHALVVGPFPPLIGPAAYHASSMLHLFKQAGYGVRSATGPGLALAGHSFNFASETRLRNSSEFLSGCSDDDFAVVYAKSFDFAKVTKPKWYKRRLEELRRLRLLVRLIRTFQTTMLVLENRPVQSRYQLSLWLVARIFGLLTGKSVCVVQQRENVAKAFEKLTGRLVSAPSAYRAEETAYDTAFKADERAPRIRLTVARAELALNYWIGREKEREDSQTARDIRQLIDVVKKHDLNRLPQFRLLWSTADPAPIAKPKGAQAKRLSHANALLDINETFGVPITRYMKHLWVSMGPSRRFRLNSAKDAEILLKWYIYEAPERVPANTVPIAQKVRNFYLSKSRRKFPEIDITSSDVVPALGRDTKPFALSPTLSRLASDRSPLATAYDVNDPIDRIGFVLEYLLSQNSKQDTASLIGPSATAFLMAPIGGDGQNVSRLGFLLAMQGRCQLEGREEVELPWESASIKQFVSHHCASVFSSAKGLFGKTARPNKPSKQVVITGLPRSETGVGSNLHMSAAALESSGLTPVILDTADEMRPIKNDSGPMGRLRPDRSLALHHVNADLIPQSVLAPALNGLLDPVHIGFLLWEFDVLPQSHLLALQLLDEIWTPSAFLKDVYNGHCDKPVLNMKKGLHFPEIPDFDRSGLGIRPGQRTFLVCFDFHSSVARKNPLAAVLAFSKAFPKKNRNVALIVKTTPSVASHWGDPENQMRKIHQIAARDDRIKIVAEYYTFNRLLSLIKSSDCLVSPHRAEGFGLMPAYALGLGRPVISTDYSGTTDFCSAQTAFPMPFIKAAVERRQVLHPVKGATWAEIDQDALITSMREVFEDPTDGLNRAKEGRRLIRSEYSVQNQTQRYQARLRELGII